jgi:hypothetical protein
MATATSSDVLASYRDQKKQLDKLAVTARKQMQARMTELLTEAAGIQADFKADFGVNPELPACVKTFTLSDGKKKDEPASDTAANGKKIGGLRRSLSAAVKKGDTTRAIELATQIRELGGTVELDANGGTAPVAAPAEDPGEPAEVDEAPETEEVPAAEEVEGTEGEAAPDWI